MLFKHTLHTNKKHTGTRLTGINGQFEIVYFEDILRHSSLFNLRLYILDPLQYFAAYYSYKNCHGTNVQEAQWQT